jgi:UDP-N-acetyl-D-galactosamine dehydrogenase
MMLHELIKARKEKVAVVGLGYVGLPLAIEFGKVVPTIAFDICEKRIRALKNSQDWNGEIGFEEFQASRWIEFSNTPADLKGAQFIIVAVPTPITKSKQPDLSCVQRASELVGRNLSKGAIVVYESTVYPGVTEEVCLPILEKESQLRCGIDFKLGYSPERMNPGDKEHTLPNILKIVSGQDVESLENIANVYALVIKAGVYRAETIKVAEAAKVIENAQRDLNIAFVNELAMLFDKMGVDTKSVLEAAGTKWNFIKMSPGLVGGHCIGVDPYYLTSKAAELGYHSQVILAGRKINDDMGKYIAQQTVKQLIFANKNVKNAQVLIMGVTFKENVKDIRNSKVIDVVNELREFGVDVCITDPLADPHEVEKEYGLQLSVYDPNAHYDAIVITVKHEAFLKSLTIPQLKKHLCKKNEDREGRESCGVVMDVKWLLDKKAVQDAGLVYWRL